MAKTRVLCLMKQHILSFKIYEILNRDYEVELLNLNDVMKNKVKNYTASFYGVDQILFTTEFIWELCQKTDRHVAIIFFENMFAVSNMENIKITYISIKYLLNKDYFYSPESNCNDFLRLRDYVESVVGSLDSNLMINVSSVYGASSETDIVDLFQNGDITIGTLEEIPCPVLADKVALFVSSNIEDRGLLTYETSLETFWDWIKCNYDEEFKAKSEDSKIREHQKHCVFDLVYKKEANSYYRNHNIAEMRIEIGKTLAKCIPADIREKLDFITPIPKTGLYYAMGLSEKLKIPYRQALIKETYSKRSFSLTNVDDRKKFLWGKIHPISELIRGKRVGVVDEAIFTGTTLKVVCEMLWECGAEEIYLCIPTPPCRYHCNYLVHPPRKMLLEYMSLEYLKEYFNVTGLFFQDEVFFAKYNRQLDQQVCLECFYGVNENE